MVSECLHSGFYWN